MQGKKRTAAEEKDEKQKNKDESEAPTTASGSADAEMQSREAPKRPQPEDGTTEPPRRRITGKTTPEMINAITVFKRQEEMTEEEVTEEEQLKLRQREATPQEQAEARDEELRNLESFEVHTTVPTPQGHKIIDLRWVDNVKPDGRVRSRRVVKDFKQGGGVGEGMEYFSPTPSVEQPDLGGLVT